MLLWMSSGEGDEVGEEGGVHFADYVTFDAPGTVWSPLGADGQGGPEGEDRLVLLNFHDGGTASCDESWLRRC
jgi:hypothetical protein